MTTDDRSDIIGFRDGSPIRRHPESSSVFIPPEFVCPVCAHEMVHIDRVDFFGSHPDRAVTVLAPEEDSDKFPEVHFGSGAGEQPVTRRHAIRLWINCEEGHRLSLTLNQHKGATLVDQELG